MQQKKMTEESSSSSSSVKKARGKRAHVDAVEDEHKVNFSSEYEPQQKEQGKEKRRKNENQLPVDVSKEQEKKVIEVEVPTDRAVRVYADGIYDLFHFGHARSLQQAKTLFPNTYLIVGVCNDKMTHELKGKTVMNERERAESLRHCKWVDEVVEEAPWIVTQPFMDEHQIDFVAHGEDIILDENGEDIYKFVKDQGRYKTIRRTEGISTSDIILRIVKDYDDYVLRNFARGYTGKQMNVGFMKEKQIKMEDKINKIRKRVKESVDRWSQEKHIANFMKSFGVRMERLVSPFKFHGDSDDSRSDDGTESDISNNPASPS